MSTAPHLSAETLIAYESGALSEGWSLAVASHLAMCSSCRDEAYLCRAAGGALLDEIDPVAVAGDGALRVLERAEREPAPALAAAPRVVAGSPIPAPLQAYVGADIDAMPWRRLGLNAHQVWIETRDKSTRVRLLRVKAGDAMPVHGHRGGEMTLALVGSVHTADGILKPGDIEEADETTVHQPVAGPESECVCLAVTGAPLRFRSLLMRVAQPFLRI